MSFMSRAWSCDAESNMVDKRWRRRKAYQQLLKQQKKEQISSAELHAAASYRAEERRWSSETRRVPREKSYLQRGVIRPLPAGAQRTWRSGSDRRRHIRTT